MLILDGFHMPAAGVFITVEQSDGSVARIVVRDMRPSARLQRDRGIDAAIAGVVDDFDMPLRAVMMGVSQRSGNDVAVVTDVRMIAVVQDQGRALAGRPVPIHRFDGPVRPDVSREIYMSQTIRNP